MRAKRSPYVEIDLLHCSKRWEGIVTVDQLVSARLYELVDVGDVATVRI